MYFDKLLEQLVSIISSTQSLNYNEKQEINRYTELIISEFIANGFVIEDIKSIQYDIPDIVRAQGGTVMVAPDFFKKLSRKDYTDEKSYYKAIESYIDNRTIEEIIFSLKDYYYIDPKDCYAIFRLEGIKGDIDSMIDDINIYAPHIKQYITETPTLSKIEKIIPDRKNLNVAIPIKHRMLNSSVAYAKQKLEKIIDFIALSYNTSAPIEYSTENISIIENGMYICGNNIDIWNDKSESSEHKDFIQYMESLDASDIKDDLVRMSERYSIINKNKTNDAQRLATSAHWYQKGKYAKNPEDKLLFHWIAIESLLKTDTTTAYNITGEKDFNLLKIVQKATISIIGKRYFHDYCFDTYVDINYKTQFYDNFFDIPEDIIEKASLNMKAGTKICISNFFKHIKDIENSVNDEMLKTELHEINSFYKDKKGLLEKEKELYTDITLIYRLRNLIAHNAVYPIYLIDLYANKSQYISSCIICFLIEKYRLTNLRIEDMLIHVSSKYDAFKLNISDEIKRLKEE